MKILRKIAIFLGFTKDDHHHANNNNDDHVGKDGVINGAPTNGFTVPVLVERAYQGPLISQCNLGEGGVQGLKWYARRLKIDEDGDVADEFLDEVFMPEPSEKSNGKAQSKLQVKYSTIPAIVRSQVIAVDGTVQQCVEYKGRLQLV